MSPLTEPTRLVLRKGWQPMDSDAATYIAAVEAADGQSLEEKTKIAIDNFVLGCKADGIWTAIKASCILAGARTLSGALVPLVGTAPTNNNFVSGDYNRKTGLGGVAGNSSKCIDTIRPGDADPQNSKHMAVYISTIGSPLFFGNKNATPGQTFFDMLNGNQLRLRINVSWDDGQVLTLNAGFAGGSRSAANAVARRVNGLNYPTSSVSQAPQPESILLFARRNGSTGAPEAYSESRMAFYSIGESLDLAKLDTRVTDLINALGAAIP